MERLFNPLAEVFIYPATTDECAGPINRPTAVKGIDFFKLQYFVFLCIFDGFLNIWYFCVESLPNRAAMPELSNWSASKAWQVLSTKKTPKI